MDMGQSMGLSRDRGHEHATTTGPLVKSNRLVTETLQS